MKLFYSSLRLDDMLGASQKPQCAGYLGAFLKTTIVETLCFGVGWASDSAGRMVFHPYRAATYKLLKHSFSQK